MLIYWLILVGLIAYFLYQQGVVIYYNLYSHPIANFPGPKIAAVSTWYKTWQECFLQVSWVHLLAQLHNQYGPIVRVGPNELHFASPEAYSDIYNPKNRWDKEESLYHSFGTPTSSFGALYYPMAIERREILAPLFSRRAICELQELIQAKADKLCERLSHNDSKGESSDLFNGLRCFPMDTMTSFCFAKSVNALDEPNFSAPIIEAMEAALPFFPISKHFSLIRKALFSMPPWLGMRITPAMAGLIELKQMLIKQVDEILANPGMLQDAPHKIIYHQLLNEDAKSGGKHPIPAQELYEEAQTLMFGGADTSSNTLMIGTFWVLNIPGLQERLQEELCQFWPVLSNPPKYEDLEKLPILTAVIKEALRISPGVASSLLRVVPVGGATINGQHIPEKTIVGMSAGFVHYNDDLFENAMTFNPDRWLAPDAAQTIEKWHIPFSRGPRACYGQNLAMAELYIGFAAVFRRFKLELDGTTPEDLNWRDCFIPCFQGKHLQAWCRPVKD